MITGIVWPPSGQKKSSSGEGRKKKKEDKLVESSLLGKIPGRTVESIRATPLQGPMQGVRSPGGCDEPGSGPQGGRKKPEAVKKLGYQEENPRIAYTKGSGGRKKTR